MAQQAEAETVTARTALGGLRGRRLSTRYGSPLLSFRGVPYARPPLGPLRFEPPQPVEPWAGTRDALEEPQVCLQIEKFLGLPLAGSEDCLYLNVYTPQLQPAAPLPVMVYVHGGGFVCGSGNADMYGPDHLVDAGVVLVTFNYRLNIFGFLSLGTEAAPGNMGLKDQVQALRWVQKNIAAFGGDPANVTLFGESAGGASVHYHLLSPLSKGLFQRAIVQSGTATCPWAHAYDSRERAFRVGRALGFSGADPDDLLAFLRTVDARRLTEASEEHASPEESKVLALSFLPVVEPAAVGASAFLSESPAAALRAGRFNPVPLVIGVTEHEGILVVVEMLKDPSALSRCPQDPRRLLPANFTRGLSEDARARLLEDVRAFYFGDRTLDASTLGCYVDMQSDVNFVAGTLEVARLHAAAAPVYLYNFSVDSPLLGLKVLLGLGDTKGTCHADELFYLFSATLLDPPLPAGSMEERTRRRLVKLWTNFAKCGNPTPAPDADLPVTWPPLEPSAGPAAYAHLDIGEDLRTRKGLRPKRATFCEQRLLPTA